MSYYRICEECGAHLDPGEVCDCQKETVADATNIDNCMMKKEFVQRLF